MKIFTKFTAFVWFLVSTKTLSFAQEKPIRNLQASIFFGIEEVRKDSLPNKENIDFMNYLYSDNEYIDNEYIGFSFSFDLFEKWESLFRLSFTDEPVLANFNLKTTYFPLKKLGLNFGFHGYSQTLSNYYLFHIIPDIEYNELYYNEIYKSVFEYGPFIGVNGNFEFGRIRLNLELNSGLDIQKPFSVSIAQNSVNSNKKALIEYHIKHSYSLFFAPEAKIAFDLIKFNSKFLGLQFRSSWYYSNKSINYNKIVYEWTKDNFTKYHVDGEKHNFSKFTFETGIYFKW